MDDLRRIDLDCDGAYPQHYARAVERGSSVRAATSPRDMTVEPPQRPRQRPRRLSHGIPGAERVPQMRRPLAAHSLRRSGEKPLVPPTTLPIGDGPHRGLSAGPVPGGVSRTAPPCKAVGPNPGVRSRTLVENDSGSELVHPAFEPAQPRRGRRHVDGQADNPRNQQGPEPLPHKEGRCDQAGDRDERPDLPQPPPRAVRHHPSPQLALEGGVGS